MKSFKIVLAFIIIFISTENIKAQHNVVYEFYKNQEKETLCKGVYIGKIQKNDKEFFKFQFDGVLIGQNRFLEILFETNIGKKTDKIVYLQETDTITNKQAPAYLLFSTTGDDWRDLSSKLKNNQLYSEYDFSKLPQSPDTFFKEANAENEDISDTVFVVSIHIDKNDWYDWYLFKVELLLWIKTENGDYLPERYKSSIRDDKEFLKIKQTR